MNTNKNKYDLQAEAFAEKTGLAMRAAYIGHFARFGDNITALYSITLARPGKRSWQFNFSTSVHDSWRYRDNRTGQTAKGLPPRLDVDKFMVSAYATAQKKFTFRIYDVEQTRKPPSLYDILACITKSNPGSFGNFCLDFGYSDDSISAKKTWQAVSEEWENVEYLFADALDELQEIA